MSNKEDGTAQSNIELSVFGSKVISFYKNNRLKIRVVTTTMINFHFFNRSLTIVTLNNYKRKSLNFLNNMNKNKMLKIIKNNKNGSKNKTLMAN